MMITLDLTAKGRDVHDIAYLLSGMAAEIYAYLELEEEIEMPCELIFRSKPEWVKADARMEQGDKEDNPQ